MLPDSEGACTLGPVVFRMDSASVNLSDHPAAPPVALRARRGPCIMAHADALGGAPVPSSLGLEGDRHVHAQAACSPQRSIDLEVHQDVVALCVSDDTGQVLERQRCACTRDA